MAIPNQLMIQMIDACQLRCKNCYLEKFNIDLNIMKFEQFKHIINWTKGLVEEIHLTPIVGEPTLHPKIYDMLDYLENDKHIKKIHMFTNLLDADVDRLNSYLKLHLIISVYGDSTNSYIEYTTKNYFNKFYNNLPKLMKFKGDCLELFIRNPNFKYNSKTGIILNILNSKNNTFIQECFWNGNWCGEYEDVENKRVNKKVGICSYAPINNSIDVNGDIILCGACDILKTTIIGNIYNQSIQEIYSEDSYVSEIYRLQKTGNYYGMCCEKCSEFHK